jgi:Putative DNA-binding domain
MSGARVLGGRAGLSVEGRGQILPGHANYALVAALDVIGPASLSSLRAGLRRWSPGRFKFVTVGIVDAPKARFAANPAKFWPEPVEIRLSEFAENGGEDAFYVFAASYGDPDDGLPNVGRIAGLIAPLLRQHRATAEVSVDDDESDFGGAYQLGIAITLPLVRRTVNDAYTLGKGVLALIQAANGGGLRRETALGLLHGQRVDVLIGQEEAEWIDFKREGYAKTERGKLELAKDVASFANADGGLLVLGVATTKAGHVETASAVTPCPPGSVSVQSYRAIVTRRIHPPPERFEMFSIPQQPDGDVWVISVPPQPDEVKPFLVHGAVLGGKVNDAYYSIVARRHDGAVPMDPQAVHALLSAGRAALRA